VSEQQRCDLCGREDHDVRFRMVRRTEAAVAATGLPRYDHIPRCTDAQACRGRVEANGRRWPIAQPATTPSTKQPARHEEVPI
jgi:hypothetical protein